MSDEPLTAIKWIAEADALLICAGAGMSATPGQNVYASEADFAHHYPVMRQKYGYRTAYECMGIGRDLDIPKSVGKAFYAKHAQNMFQKFGPNDGYRALLDLCKGKSYFVHTSNVDGMFAKAGFDPERIYTPQGEMAYRQCATPCCRETWCAKDMHEKMIAATDPLDMTLPDEAMPKCPNCGAGLTLNLRGSDTFVHARYQSAQDREIAWIEELKRSGQRLAVIEVGAGFNSPVVTRFPMESIVRELGAQAALIRLNPTEHEVPSDLPRAVGLPEGWQALVPIEAAVAALDDSSLATATQAEARVLSGRGMQARPERWQVYARRFGHFDWRRWFYELSDAGRHGSAHTEPDSAPLPSLLSLTAKSSTTLRFQVGDKVLANCGEWLAGTVIALWYTQEGFPPDTCAPYKVQLDAGPQVWAPRDEDHFICAAGAA